MTAISSVSVPQPAVNPLVQSAAVKRPQTNPTQAPAQASKGAGGDADHDGDSDSGGIDVSG
jgi:hypothetical protein